MTTLHPLIDSLNFASTSAARVARNLQIHGYTYRDGNGIPDDSTAHFHLADALSSDRFGVSSLNDRLILDDRHASTAAKDRALIRSAWRQSVRTALGEFSPEVRRDCIDAIASEVGAHFAGQLQARADELLAGHAILIERDAQQELQAA